MSPTCFVQYRSPVVEVYDPAVKSVGLDGVDGRKIVNAVEPPDLPRVDGDERRALGSSYVVSRVIGRGASGEVWAGVVRDTGEPIAAKILAAELTSDPDLVARFIRERAMLTRVTSAHVVTVRDLVVEGDTLAIIADLVNGPNLRTVIDQSGTLAPDMAMELCEQILDGLAAVHAQGLVHRDLKPENVLIEQSPDGEAVARIADFGIAQLAHGENSQPGGELVGSAEYIAPELLEGGQATPQSDLYALGIMLYELLCGRTPFAAGMAVTVLRRHVDEPPGRPAGMPDAVWPILLKLLAKNPQLRPVSADAASAMLRSLAASVAGLDALPVVRFDDPLVLGDGDETIIATRRAVGEVADTGPGPTTRAARRGRGPRRGRRVAMIGMAVVLVAGGTTTALVATEDAAGAASLTTFPDRYHSNLTTATLVRRTFVANGSDIAVSLDVEAKRNTRATIVEYLADSSKISEVRGAVVNAANPGAHRVVLELPSSAKVHQTVTYRAALSKPVTTFDQLAKYERGRLGFLKADTADLVPDTIAALVSVPPAVRVSVGERAWLHLGGRTVRAEQATVYERGDWHNAFANVQWTSSNPHVAKAGAAVDTAAAARSTSYPVIVALAPGSTVLTANVGGETRSIFVVVSTQLGGGPCEAGVGPVGSVSLTDTGVFVEGSLVRIDGVKKIQSGGILAASRRVWCTQPVVVEPTAELRLRLAALFPQ